MQGYCFNILATKSVQGTNTQCSALLRDTGKLHITTAFPANDEHTLTLPEDLHSYIDSCQVTRTEPIKHVQFL